MWKTHAPRQGGRNAVVAIAGEQTANPSDGIAERARRRTGIQKSHQRKSGTLAEKKERSKAAEKPAKPGKTITIEDDKGKPLQSANVIIDGTWYRTNVIGRVTFSIERGTHKIQIEKPGYVTIEHEIQVNGRISKILKIFGTYV